MLSDYESAEQNSATQFDTLLSEASAAFIRALADEIDFEIEAWLQRFCAALGIHKAVVIQLDPNDGKLAATQQWVEGSVLPSILATAVEDYPWLASKIRSGELVVLDDVEEALSEASNDLSQTHRRGGKATVCVPLRIGGELAGAVAFVSAVKRKWSARTVQQLHRLTEIFGIALERRRSSALIRKLREESQNVLRVVPMAEITASLAHELNQPLGSILNNAQAARRLLNADRADIAELKDAVEGIINDVGRATATIRHAREVFQSVVEGKGSVDIRELLLDVERVLRKDAKARNISLRLTLSPSLPRVIGNRQGLMQVLMNLVLNAFDSIAECSDSPREVEISAHSDSTEVHVTVQDTGKGIDPRIMSRLFNAFVTTKTKGTGMGLAMSRSIIEKNGGRIWAAPKGAPGAIIEFTLPIQT